MKRTITVKAGAVSIVATINSRGYPLIREEVETLRDELADRLQDAAANLIYVKTPRNRVVVR